VAVGLNQSAFLSALRCRATSCGRCGDPEDLTAVRNDLQLRPVNHSDAATRHADHVRNARPPLERALREVSPPWTTHLTNHSSKLAGSSVYTAAKCWPISIQRLTIDSLVVDCCLYEVLTDQFSGPGRTVASVCICVFLSVRTIGFELTDLWFRYLPC